MEKVQSAQDIAGLQENRIIGSPELCNTQILFKGRENILYCEEGVRLKDSRLEFNGDHSIVFLGKSHMDTILHVSVNFDSVFGFGRENYINGILKVIISEQTNVLIGSDCVISFGCWLRTADPHLIYDAETKQRINPSRSIYLGDHIWLGQGAVLLKNTQVGSGTIIGAMSVVPGKRLISNASYAGNPCKKVKENIFFTGDCVHRYRKTETEQHTVYTKGDNYIYSCDETTIEFDEIEKKLKGERNMEEKLEYVRALYENPAKNRFAVSENNSKGNLWKWKKK